MNPKSFTFMSKDGLLLLGRAWMTTYPQPKGMLYLVHGLGEHSGRYDHIGKTLKKAGYHLVGFDLRGHGLSEGPRGHSPGFSHLMDDIRIFLNESTKYLGNSLPKFLYGHSFGGNLVINFGLRNHIEFKGAIVTSPALSTASPPPKTKVMLAKVFGNILPGISFKSGLKQDALSRDAAIVKAYQDDVYVHDTISARLGLDLLESGQAALENAQNWQAPLLLMHGTADQITSWTASQIFAEHAGDPVELHLWPNYYHELHNDFGSENVIQKMIGWLNQNNDG